MIFSSFQITERGTEAAAATSAFIFRMGPSKVMQFDRPFFLFIYDALNKVLLKIFDEVMNTFDQGCLILGSSGRTNANWSGNIIYQYKIDEK